RITSVYFFLEAFRVPATLHNALLVLVVQSLSTLFPFTPGGVGTQQGLLVYVFRRAESGIEASLLLSFSAGMSRPTPLLNVVAGYVRYTTQLEAYLFLAANPYPGFWLVGEDDYPVTLEIDGPERQNRWKTLFRLPLAVPALLLSAALLTGGVRAGGYAAGLAFSVAFLLWWMGLFLGRAPRGMRDLVAYCIGYSAQLAAYLFLVTDRYPYS